MFYSDTESDTNYVGLLDIMSTLALLFILLAAIFMVDLRAHMEDLGAMNTQNNVMSLQNDSMRKQIVSLNQLQRSYVKLKNERDSLTGANNLYVDSLAQNKIAFNRNIDSLAQKNLILLQELEKRQVAKIIIPNELKGKVFFKSGASKIEGQFKKSLDQYVRMIKDSISSGRYNLVQVEGHTDSDKISSKKTGYKDNWELGAARALAVVKYFTSEGIEPQYLSATTHSEFKPNDPETDNPKKGAKDENRRIEIVLLKK